MEGSFPPLPGAHSACCPPSGLGSLVQHRAQPGAPEGPMWPSSWAAPMPGAVPLSAAGGGAGRVKTGWARRAGGPSNSGASSLRSVLLARHILGSRSALKPLLCLLAPGPSPVSWTPGTVTSMACPDLPHPLQGSNVSSTLGEGRRSQAGHPDAGRAFSRPLCPLASESCRCPFP